MKVKVSVSIDKKVYEKAHSLGINVSKASENYLITLINAIEQTNGTKRGFSRGFSAEKSRMVRSPGFEPGSSAWQSIDWKAYNQWLRKKNYRGNWRSTLLAYGKECAHYLFDGKMAELAGLSASQKSNILKALSSLSKFLGCYESFQRQRKDHGLTWGGKTADDLIIDRLSKIENPEEVWSWVRQAKQKREDLTEFMDLIGVTGMRLVEAVESYNLIIELARKKQLGDYYNRDGCVLEHFKFKDLFIRKSKKLFFSFVPAEVVDAASESCKVSSANALSSYFRRNSMHSRFSDVREAHATFMTQFLKPSEIDFLHGRCATSVFMKHYFNPALIGDLRERAFKGIREIQKKIVLETN